MSTPEKRSELRKRGVIQTLPSGALRARLYSGVDPLTGRRVYLTETIPADHPEPQKEAQRALTRLLTQVDEKRAPRTQANVNKLMDRYLELLDVGVTTRKSYEGYIRNHVRPLLGKIPVGKLDGETLDSFYAILRKCRAHCGGRKYIVHRKDGAHDCTDKCRPHVCKPLKPSSIRQIHWCLSGALSRAQRWKWITVNPLDHTETPKGTAPDPQPPSAEQAAAIVNAAFKDIDWGILVWLAMTTGARRGELCAMQWDLLNLDKAVLTIRSGIAQDGSTTWEKETKTHQQRRISLDEVTVGLLRAYRQHREAEARKVGARITKKGRIFSPDVDHVNWIKPSTVSQRYSRMCKKLGLDMHIHQLRHYSATELISSGVDVRTVAGRLGHGGGGATTLRVYSAWVAEADQRAAGSFTAHMPSPPIAIDTTGKPVSTREPETGNAYEKIAAHLRGAIMFEAFKIGDRLPPVKELAARYHVAASTAHRAIELLETEGFVTTHRGKPTIVASVAPHQSAEVIPLRARRKA